MLTYICVRFETCSFLESREKKNHYKISVNEFFFSWIEIGMFERKKKKRRKKVYEDTYMTLAAKLKANFFSISFILCKWFFFIVLW
jgi:hypothetical protein